MSLSWLEDELLLLENKGLKRVPRVLQNTPQPEVTIDGKKVLLFCSNDYLGLSSHPSIKEAATAAIEQYGVGMCSSRLVSGTHQIHRQLEYALAHWLAVESSLLFSSGFAVNLAVLSSLAGSGDVIISDELNHASIVKGCRLSRASVAIYPHCNLDELEKLLKKHKGARRRFVVTDAIFSVDGDVAPISEINSLCQMYRASLIVDEAHSLGVVGPKGRGLCALNGVVPDVLVGTFGKVFGVVGAFVAGRKSLIEYLTSTASSLIYTTASPPVLSASVMASLELLKDADKEREKLCDLSQKLRSSIEKLGCSTGDSRFHIIPSMIGGVHHALDISQKLFDLGVFVQPLRPPTVAPGTERLRWTPTALHSDDQIDFALEKFAEVLEAEKNKR